MRFPPFYIKNQAHFLLNPHKYPPLFVCSSFFFVIALFIYLNRIYFQNVIKERKSSTRNRIIPPDEDIRRLFQECKIGQGNASLLSQALALTKPEDLKRKEIIRVRKPLILGKRKTELTFPFRSST